MGAKLSLVSIVAALAAAVMLAASPSAAESTWDQIKRTGKLRYGAVDYPPNWFRDKTSGKWTGFLVEMVEDVAKDMGVEAVPVETTWATCVLDLQSNKTDLQFGLQATPKRALVIDFAGPAYNLYWYAVNHNGFKASAWEDYNKPEVKVADLTLILKLTYKDARGDRLGTLQLFKHEKAGELAPSADLDPANPPSANGRLNQKSVVICASPSVAPCHPPIPATPRFR